MLPKIISFGFIIKVNYLSLMNSTVNAVGYSGNLQFIKVWDAVHGIISGTGTVY